MEQRPVVVLLHGLARSPRAMARLARAVQAEGYRTCAPPYPSRRATLDEMARGLCERVYDEVGDAPLFAVTHSMGGIVARHMAAVAGREEAPAPRWCGSVLIAPPNRGSAVARLMRDKNLARWFYGPALEQLAAGDVSSWPPPPRPCGVIAGTRPFALINPTSWLTLARRVFDGPSDGTVGLDETKLADLDGFATVDANHTLIMNHPETQRLVLRFIEAGTFVA